MYSNSQKHLNAEFYTRWQAGSVRPATLPFSEDSMPDSTTTTTDLSQVIAQQAQQAAATSLDGMSVSQRSIADLITAAEFLKKQQAASNPLRSLKFFKLKSNN